MTALTRFDNGVSILSHSMPGRRSAALGIWIARGTRDDAPDEAGYTHLLEHLLYRDIDRQDGLIERFGGDINACTARELMALHGTIPGDRLDALASHLSERLLRPAIGDRFQDRDLSSEQRAVLHEIAGWQGSLQSFQDHILARVWSGHPLARPLAGDPDVIRRATANSLRPCHGRILRGPNLCVVAAGAVTHDALVDACRPLALLPADQSPDVPARTRTAPAFTPFEGHLQVESGRSTLIWIMPVAPYGVADAHITLAERIMAGDAGAGRLPRELRDRLGLVYGIDSRLERYSDCGLWWLQLECLPGQTGPCRRAVEAVFRGLIKDGPAPEDIERARAALHARRIIDDDDPKAVMERLARDFIGLGRIRSLDERHAALTRSGPEPVREVIADAWEQHALFGAGPAAAGVALQSIRA